MKDSLEDYADFTQLDLEIKRELAKTAYEYFRQVMLARGLDLGCAHPSLPVFVHGFQECPDCGHIFRLADKEGK